MLDYIIPITTPLILGIITWLTMKLRKVIQKHTESHERIEKFMEDNEGLADKVEENGKNLEHLKKKTGEIDENVLLLIDSLGIIKKFVKKEEE